MITRHRLCTFSRADLIAGLDALAADGWEVLACWPEGAGYQCLLWKLDASDCYLAKPWLRTNMLASALEQLPGEQEET